MMDMEAPARPGSPAGANGKHKFEFVAEDKPKNRGHRNGVPTALDTALKRYTHLGEKVLNFWRENGGWTFKVMA